MIGRMKKLQRDWLLYLVMVTVIMFGFLTSTNSCFAAKTRDIGVVAKTLKGKPQNVHLYDYSAALIIGVDRYENLGVKHQLSYAVKDAKGVEAVLRKNYQFAQIKTLYNEQASRENIMEALYGFRSLSPESAVFVYFAGHGITESGALAGKDLGFLIPFDGYLKSSKMYKNISMQQIKSDICASITAKHVYFVFDACFAGLMLDTRSTSIQTSHDFSYLKSITSEQVRQILTAGAKGQRVLDGGPGGHSVFTGRFIQALENVQDYITASELGQKLRKQVYADAAARGHAQRPVDGEIYGTGDFVFVPDTAKKQKQTHDRVAKLEAELERLNQLKKKAASRKETAQEREIERERLLKEAEIKKARLQNQAAQREARQQKELAAKLLKDKNRLAKEESERKQRLAYLKKQTEKMLEEFGGSVVSAGGIDGAQKELKRIIGSISGIEAAYQKELENEIWSLLLHYEKQFKRTGNIPPFDKMFETDVEYKNRLGKATAKIKDLGKGKYDKEQSIKNHLQTELEKDLEPLHKQIKQITDQAFEVGSGQITFKLTKYHPELECFSITGRVKNVNMGGLVNIPKARARTYYSNPELLVASAKLSITDKGVVYPSQLIFRGPENDKYNAKVSRTMTDKITGMEFMYVPGGCYEMGCGSWAGKCWDSQKPAHTVCVNGFYMGKYEVTQAQWKKIMGNNPSRFSECGNNCPVERVSWYDAQKFIKRLNQKSGSKYHLPTEAQWEYAARSGGKKEKYAGGNAIDSLAWYNSNSGGKTHPVGTKNPNGLGLYDMSGNVCEWCQDVYNQKAYDRHTLNNPIYKMEGSGRVKRGGEWWSGNGGSSRRSVSRGGDGPDNRRDYNGFRLVLLPGQ